MMAHMRIAIFFESRTYTNEQINTLFDHAKLNMDYCIVDWAPTKRRTAPKVEAFITVEGRLIDVNQVYWNNANASEVECRDAFITLLKRYYEKACREHLYVLIADCHM